MKIMISADFPEQRGPGPRPGPGPILDRRGKSGSRAPPSRARGRESGPEPTGIRPRADRNPAPIPIPSPPFKNLPYSLPVRVGGKPHPLTPLSQTVNRVGPHDLDTIFPNNILGLAGGRILDQDLDNINPPLK